MAAVPIALVAALSSVTLGAPAHAQRIPVAEPLSWRTQLGQPNSGAALVGLMKGSLAGTPRLVDSLWVRPANERDVRICLRVQLASNRYRANAEYLLPASPEGAFLRLRTDSLQRERQEALRLGRNADVAALAEECTAEGVPPRGGRRMFVASWSESASPARTATPGADSVYALVGSRNTVAVQVEGTRERPCQPLARGTVAYQFACPLGVIDSLGGRRFRIRSTLGGTSGASAWYRIVP